MRKFLKLSSLSTVTLLGFATAAHAVPIGSAYVGGLLQVDYANFSGDKTDVAVSSGDIRRAKLWIKGDLGDDWSYQISTRNLTNTEGFIPDASWIGYDGFDVAWLAVGLIDAPGSLGYWSGYQYNTFMEYAGPIQAFGPPRGIGIYADAEAMEGLFSYQLAAYVPDITEAGLSSNPCEIIDGVKYNTLGSDSDQWGFAGRAVAKPQLGVGDVTAIGASIHYESLSETQGVNALVTTPGALGRSTTGTNIRNNILVSTVAPEIGDLKNSTTFGFEGAFLWGPLTTQAEFLRTYWDGRGSVSDLSFWGAYGQVSYVLTGEPRAYDNYSATIGPVEYITNPFGAWELALRYAFTDLSDNPSSGYGENNDDKTGKQWDWTGGINWYVTDNVIFRGEYVYARATYNNSTGRSDKNVKTMAIRGQVSF